MCVYTRTCSCCTLFSTSFARMYVVRGERRTSQRSKTRETMAMRRFIITITTVPCGYVCE